MVSVSSGSILRLGGNFAANPLISVSFSGDNVLVLDAMGTGMHFDNMDFEYKGLIRSKIPRIREGGTDIESECTHDWEE